MSIATLSMLDQAELFQLALNASAGDDSASAIAYLKEAVGRADATGAAHYLLGAEYAQIKMYERASDEMEAALAIDPTLSAARLQLGLLWTTKGEGGKALAVLGPLSELADTEALHWFGRGLCELVQDKLGAARASLLAGIARNMQNPALNVDMQSIVNEIDAAGAAEAPGEAPTDEGAGRHIFLGAYSGNTSH